MIKFMEEFNKNFSKFRNFNIALYGLGAKTEQLIDKAVEYNFTALLDGYVQSGKAYGRKIVTIKELASMNIFIIVIVARPASTKVIYKKIKDECALANIRVFDLNGIELSLKVQDIYRSHQYFNSSSTLLKEVIKSHVTVSFDFDVAFIDHDKDNVVLRPGMKKIFELANLVCDRVYIVIEDAIDVDSILLKNDMNIRYNIVSIDYIRKNNNTINHIHVGIKRDNRDDYDFFLLLRPIGMMEISSFFQIFNEKEMKSRIIQKFINRVFADPFCLEATNGKCRITNPYEFGYSYIAPAIYNFALWIVKESDGFDRIWFISRDGYLIKKIFDNINGNNPKSDYIYISRSMGVCASLYKEDDIYNVVDSFDGTRRELLQKRFFLEDNEIDDDIYEMSLKNCLKQYSSKILEKATKIRNQYIIYMKKLNIDDCEKILLYDFVSTGTCQMCLESLINRALQGIYYAKPDVEVERKKNLSVITYSNYDTKGDAILDNYFLLENILKEPVPSLKMIDSEGKPVYYPENRTHEVLDTIRRIQNGILDYCNDYQTRKGNKVIANKILSLIDEKYTNMQIPYLFDCKIRDEYCNRNLKLTV